MVLPENMGPIASSKYPGMKIIAVAVAVAVVDYKCALHFNDQFLI